MTTFEPVVVNVTNGEGKTREVYILNSTERRVASFSVDPNEAFTLPEGWEEIANATESYAAEYAASLCNIDGYILIPVSIQR